MPAILIYWGDKIENNPLHMDEDAPQFWRKARSQYHEAAQSRDYPVDAKLGLHLIEQLIAQGFDISQSKRLAKEHGEGHAFGFVHRRMMSDARHADRAGGAQHLFPAQPAAAAPLLRAGPGDPRRRARAPRAARASASWRPAA